MHSAEHSILMSQWPDAGNAYILASNDQHQINKNNQISHTQNKQTTARIFEFQKEPFCGATRSQYR